MDIQDEGAHLILITIADCHDRLRNLVLPLYVQASYAEKKVAAWNSGLQLTGPASLNSRYSGIIIGASLILTQSVSIWFEIQLTWRVEGWDVKGDIFVQDDSDHAKFLWEYQSPVIEGVEKAALTLLSVTDQMIEQGNKIDYGSYRQTAYGRSVE